MITYLISVYPLVSEIHTAAQVAGTDGDEARPARLIVTAGRPPSRTCADG